PVLQRGLGDPGIPLGPIGAVAREQAHALILPDDQHPVAIVLYLVDPVRPRRDLLAGGRQAEFVRNKHEPKIRTSGPIYESGTARQALAVNPCSYTGVAGVRHGLEPRPG